MKTIRTACFGFKTKLHRSLACLRAQLGLAVVALGLVAGAPTEAADGWASVNGDTTGGAGGATVTVSTAADLITYATATSAYVIRVQGNINLSATLSVNSNKTIEGVDANSTIDGEIYVGDGKSNVIIRNLNITNDRTVGTGDGIRLYGCNHVWVDHCTIFNCDDGCVDNSNNTDYITISWCKFYYTRDNGHNFVNLIGAADTDTGNYRITFHHNWWSTLCRQRMPAQRFGQVHMYNNYFNCPGNGYCSNVRLNAEMLSENNYYDSVDDPIYKSDTSAKIKTAGNTYVNTTGLLDPGTDTVFNPPYSYILDPTADIPTLVTTGAGNGGGGAPPEPPVAPTNLTANPGTKKKINLSWTDNSNNESGFKIERSTNGVNFSQIATVGADATAYINGGLTSGTTYYYRVRAYNSSGDSAYSSVASATAP
jgi:pectate lyase